LHAGQLGDLIPSPLFFSLRSSDNQKSWPFPWQLQRNGSLAGKFFSLGFDAQSKMFSALSFTSVVID